MKVQQVLIANYTVPKASLPLKKADGMETNKSESNPKCVNPQQYRKTKRARDAAMERVSQTIYKLKVEEKAVSSHCPN